MEKQFKKPENALPDDAEIKKWKENVNLKFFEKKEYETVDQIDNENPEILLGNFRKEIKEMQENIKKLIMKGSEERVYANRTAMLNLKPECLGIKEARIWEKFKLISNYDDIALFEHMVFDPYKKEAEEEVAKETEYDVQEVVSAFKILDTAKESGAESVLEELETKIKEIALEKKEVKQIYDDLECDFKNLEKWGILVENEDGFVKCPSSMERLFASENMKDKMKKSELLDVCRMASIRAHFARRHPRMDFAEDLMGNRIGDIKLVLKDKARLSMLEKDNK